MKEADLQRSVIGVARLFGWRVAHFRTAQTSKGRWLTPVGGDGKGFPDLCLVRERVVFIELKTNYRKLEPEQEVWRDWIVKAGGEHYTFTDKDWEAGRIEVVLQLPHTSIRSSKMKGMHDEQPNGGPSGFDAERGRSLRSVGQSGSERGGS